MSMVRLGTSSLLGLMQTVLEPWQSLQLSTDNPHQFSMPDSPGPPIRAGP